MVFSSVDLARREHWAQVFAEFYVLPAERPCVLRLQLGGGATTRFSGLHVGRPGPQVNVAFGMAVSSSGSEFFQQAERVLGRAVSDQALTNGMMDDQWTGQARPPNRGSQRRVGGGPAVAAARASSAVPRDPSDAWPPNAGAFDRAWPTAGSTSQ